jgi:hypothetical protein
VGSTVNVSLGKFARHGIEARLGSNVRVGVLAALIHYTRRLKSGTLPVPPIKLPGESGPAGAAASFELQVGADMRAALEQQARVHQVPLNQVLVHAVFVYLADLESSPELAETAGTPLH